MAKCGITNIGGGGGIGSDELTVTKDYVLSGLEYVGADTDDEKGVGVMINNGTTANQNINAGGSFLVKGGYHAQPFTVNANSLASQTSGTAASSKILNGETAWVNGSKITGTITSMAGQTVSPTASQQTVASSGKYMTGNVVVNGVSNLTATNIKKGVNVGGTLGTFEGYVPTATDLYLRGNNSSNLREVYSGSWIAPTYYRFDSGQITAVANPTTSYYLATQRNLAGFTYINVEGYDTSSNTYAIRIGASGDLGVIINNGSVPNAFGYATSVGNHNVTGSLNIANINAICYVKIWFPGTVVLHRLWLS